MEAVIHAFAAPLRPLGSLLHPNVCHDNDQLRRLLWDQVYAVPNSEVSLTEQSSRDSSQVELVDYVVKKALHLYGEDGHMLSLGYRNAGRGNFETKIDGGIESRFPNWIVSFLKTSIWDELLRRIGSATMIRILWDLPMIALKEGSHFVQLTGRPLNAVLSERGRSMGEEGKDEKASNLLILKPDNGAPFKSRQAPTWGFSSNHPLRKFQVQGKEVSREQARNLALYISQNRTSGTSTKAPLKKRSRLSPFWVAALPYLQKIMTAQRTCPYTKLYDNAQGAVKVSWSGENSEALMLSLRNYDTPVEVVSVFLKSVLFRIIPRAMWGSKTTRRMILSRIERFVVRSNSKHPVTVDHLVEDLPITSFHWLRCLLGTKRELREGKRDLSMWITFLFQDICMGILSSCFFLAKDDVGRTVYYTKRAWRTKVCGDLASELVDQLQKCSDPLFPTTLKALRERFAKRRFGIAKVRFIQKKNSCDFRMIMNLSAKSAKFPFSINAALRPAFNALTFELKEDPSLGGSFVQGLDDIYARYVPFILKRKQFQHASLNLYGVALDIRKCYDTMRHAIVLDCVSATLKQDEYAISLRQTSYADYGMRIIRTKRIRQIRPSHLDEVGGPPGAGISVSAPEAQEGTSRGASYIATDGVIRQYCTRDKALNLVSELINHTYVEFQEEYYHLREGIPQGSIISTLLCRLYYGRFEKTELSGRLREGEDLLMRLVDDFLLLTPNKETAEWFERKMGAGHPDWGCFINKRKTRKADFALRQQCWIPWCGLLIDVRRGWVRIHYDEEDSFPVARIALRGVGKTMRGAFGIKCHPLLLDLRINSATNVLINIGQLFTVCAVRFFRYLDFVDRNSDCKMASDEISDLFHFAYSRIHYKVSYKAGFVCMKDVTCIGWLAFAVRAEGKMNCDVARMIQDKYVDSLKQRRAFFKSERIDWKKVKASVIAVAGIL